MVIRRPETEVLIIGAGVAGCAAAIALRLAGVEVTVADQLRHRPQRFCGEFVSGEAIDFLKYFDVLEPLQRLAPNHVRRLSLHGLHNRPFVLPLANEGLGISRRSLDAALLDRALELGATVIEGARIETICGEAPQGYEITLFDTESLARLTIRSQAVIGAHGKRSSIDRLLNREFLSTPSRFVGVKQHYRGADRGRDVELYLFPGGYCGVVGIEEGLTNLCLLANRTTLQKAGGRPEDLIDFASRANPSLARWIERAQPVPGSLLAISQIPFIPKDQVSNGVFMVGDSAGVQAPFLGIGVAAALRSASTCAQILTECLRGDRSFNSACHQYRTWWRKQFAGKRRWGNLASRLLCRPGVGGFTIRVLNRFPVIGERFYRQSRTAIRRSPLAPGT